MLQMFLFFENNRHVTNILRLRSQNSLLHSFLIVFPCLVPHYSHRNGCFRIFAPKFWKVVSANDSFALVSMQLEWCGQSEMVGTLKFYLLLN